MLIRALLCFLAIVCFVQAETHIPLTAERLARESDLVIRGQVLGKTVAKDPAGRIYTQVDLAVQQVWKGAWTPSELTLVHGGGILGEIGTRVIGQADYELDEEVILFLTRGHGGRFITVGMADGKFEVQRRGDAEVAVQSGTKISISIATLRQQVEKVSSHD